MRWDDGDWYQDHLNSLTESVRLSRRGFWKAGLAAGFAAAACPISAATIHTDTNGLTAGDIQIPTANGMIPGYRAKPAHGHNFPICIVIQEAYGLHEHMKDVCRRLAKHGFYGIGAEMYYRQGDVSKLTDTREIIKIVAAVPNAQVMSDLDACVAYAADDGADPDKLTLSGFCWGGWKAWLYTAYNPKVKAAAAWYGNFFQLPGFDGPTPMEVASKVKGRVLGLYGALDKGIKLEHIDAMRKALAAAGDAETRIIVFPYADHGFNADYRPSYNEAASKEGWIDTYAWFKAHGVVGHPPS
jgi:carboxymethylenebutenolidase